MREKNQIMKVKEISVNEIKKNMQTFFNRLEAGETLVILKSGKPLAEIKPVRQSKLKTRPFGLCQGEFTVPDDFDEALPSGILDEFVGR